MLTEGTCNTTERKRLSYLDGAVWSSKESLFWRKDRYIASSKHLSEIGRTSKLSSRQEINNITRYIHHASRASRAGGQSGGLVQSAAAAATAIVTTCSAAAARW